MKTTIQTRPVIFTRSMLALGFGCALAAAPLGSVFAQDSTPSVPTTAGEVNTTKNDPLNTGEAVPKTTEKTAKSGAKLSVTEKQFMNKAGAGNVAEVMMAELALKNAESQDVKDFAQKMITDHKEANAKLDVIAKSHGQANFDPMPSDEDKAFYAQLTSLTGSAFDTAYIKHAVVDHETDLKDYQKGKKEVKDKELMAYTDKTEKVVADHLKMAKELQAKTVAANH